MANNVGQEYRKESMESWTFTYTQALTQYGSSMYAGKHKWWNRITKFRRKVLVARMTRERRKKFSLPKVFTKIIIRSLRACTHGFVWAYADVHTRKLIYQKTWSYNFQHQTRQNKMTGLNLMQRTPQNSYGFWPIVKLAVSVIRMSWFLGCWSKVSRTRSLKMANFCATALQNAFCF